MATPGKKPFVPVDYSKRHGDRRRLTRYLRSGIAKKIAGHQNQGHHIFRNRLIMATIMAAVIAVGVFYVTR